MTDCKDSEEKPEKTIEALCGMTCFGYPIIWTENIHVGDITLTDWRSYVRFKFKEEEPGPEGGE